MEKTLSALYSYGLKYDNCVLPGFPQSNIQGLLSNTPFTFSLGRGGVLYFAPMVPGLGGVAHIFVWDPMYFRRQALIRAVLRYSFKKWDLQRISATIPTRNTLAIRYAQSIGFKREGTMRRAVLYNGGADDSALLGILPEEVAA